MSRLEDFLVLNRYMHHLLGAEDFESLKALLRPLPEGPDGSGQSHFFRRLATQPELRIPQDRLEQYDRRVMEYEAKLRRTRRDFQGFRYFQYLALLYTEIFLDKLTENPTGFFSDLNAFLDKLRKQESQLKGFPDFTLDALRRLAFFMATGSGKTLLMHVNIWQVLYYLEHGAHPEALVPGNAPRRQFDNILLITPNEGLSAQHLTELRESGFDAGLFIEDPHGQGGLFGPKVKVIEISKLAEEPSREGVSVLLEEIGPNNLVIVDEGHKGTGSEARTWKRRQKYLSDGGFLLEYSATFAQAIAAARGKAKKELYQEYGQAILFDYSYAHFYGDGYGKDFVVLNLQDSRSEQAHELLVGGLLVFYQQLYLYRENLSAYRPYNIEKPLWVLLGSSVNAVYTQNKERRSDVAEVVAFLKRFVENREWAISTVARILFGESGFQDSESGQDLFAPHVKYLRGQDPDRLYERILAEVFHGSGGLEVWELKQAEGELGLRLSTAEESAPYFGVINIGDVSEFKKYLAEHVGIEVQEDRFRSSQFGLIDHPESPIYLLIGAKKFIEGWSSWRVSSMGLLNVGKGKGPQIIQLFGRGVRLKGKDMSLKRSKALQDGQPPEGLSTLETLMIFGWNANYIQTFREIIKHEGVGKEFTLRVRKMEPWPEGKLFVPQRKASFDPSACTWELDASGPDIKLDLAPKLVALATTGETAGLRERFGEAVDTEIVDFSKPRYALIMDREALYLEALEYKRLRGYDNLYIAPEAVEEVLRRRCRVVLPTSELRPERVQQVAVQSLKHYIDRFMRMKEREIEGQNVKLSLLTADDPRVLEEYRVRVKGNEELVQQIEELVRQIEDSLQKEFPKPDEGEPLPRLYFDRSLFNPLLAEGGRDWKENISVYPPALNRDERRFIEELRAFWRDHHQDEGLRNWELYVLRNVARTGIGLFHRSGFYPDFILWLHDVNSRTTRIVFVDPHGLHHGGLAANEDRFAALKALRALSETPEFKAKRIALDGYILTRTPLEHIPDAAGRSKEELESEKPLIFMKGNYIQRLLKVKGAEDA